MMFRQFFYRLQSSSPVEPESFAAPGRCTVLLLIFAASVFALACTAQSKELKPAEPSAANTAPASEQKQLLSAKEPVPSLQALETYKETLRSRGELLEDQGILIESLDGNQTFASHNADNPFNPASVMKIAT